jgi:hypothetical protein
MASFAYEFDMVNSVVRITTTSTAETATGYYAFELIAPTGVKFKSVSTAFFATPAPNADSTYPVGSAFQISLPKDINDVVLYGTYQIRALYKETGVYGNNDNSFAEAFRNVAITKAYGLIDITPNLGLNQLDIVDTTDYGTSTVSSRLLTAYVIGGVATTSTNNTLSISPINDYVCQLTSNIVQTYSINATYSATALQTVNAIVSSISYIANLSTTIAAAKKLLDSYDDVFCSQNRRLTDNELAKYLQLTSKLALIGAALHASSSTPSAIDAMKELELLVQ